MESVQTRTKRRQVQLGLSGNVKQLELLRREVKEWEIKLQEAKGLRKQDWELGNYPKDNGEPTCGLK